MKKLFTTMAMATLVTLGCNLGTVQAFTAINKEPNKTFLYMDQMEKSFYKPNAYHIGFQASHEDNKLRIYEAESKLMYTVLSPYENTGVAYDIIEIPVAESNRGLFAVSATAGAHAQNLGYWLIGVKDGKVKVYVDYAKLAKNGFKPDEWNRLYGKYEESNQGFAITNTTEYMPPWGQTSVDLIDMQKAKWACRWNEKKQAFDLEAVPTEKPAFIDEQYKAMLYMEQFIKARPKFKSLLDKGQLSYVCKNPDLDQGLENHEIQVIEDNGEYIVSKASFIINEIAEVQYYNPQTKKYEKVK